MEREKNNRLTDVVFKPIKKKMWKEKNTENRKKEK